MKITSNKSDSIANQLATLIKNALPNTSKTEMSKDLMRVSPDPKGKGKSVLFVFRKATLRLTENLKVMELNFCNTWENTEVAKEASELIMKALNVSTEVTAESTPEPVTPTVTAETITIPA